MKELGQDHYIFIFIVFLIVISKVINFNDSGVQIKHFEFLDKAISSKYKRDQISLPVTIDLAMSSYLKGCMDTAKKKHSYSECLNLAKKHVKNDIVGILHQN